MYFTDYFNGLKINSIETTIIDLINDIDSLSSTVSKIRDTIKDTNDWTSNAKIKLDKGLYKIEWRLNTLKDKLNKFKEATDIAKVVIDYQKEMKNETDINNQKNYATKINIQINKFKEKVLEIRDYSGTKDELYNGNYHLIDYSSDVFQLNKSKIKNIKADINEFSKNINEFINKMNTLEFKVSNDEYLYWTFGIVYKTVDKIGTLNSKTTSWISNYIENIEKIENSLPESEYQVEVSISQFSLRSFYPSKPTFESYQKSHFKDQIKDYTSELDSSDAKASYDTDNGSNDSNNVDNNDNTGDNGSPNQSDDSSQSYDTDNNYNGDNNYNNSNNNTNNDDNQPKPIGTTPKSNDNPTSPAPKLKPNVNPTSPTNPNLKTVQYRKDDEEDKQTPTGNNAPKYNQGISGYSNNNNGNNNNNQSNNWDMRPDYQKLGSNLHYGGGSSDPNSSTYNPVSAKAYLNTNSGGSHDF